MLALAVSQGSQKSLGYIVGEEWMCVQNVVPIPPVDAEIFQVVVVVVVGGERTGDDHSH